MFRVSAALMLALVFSSVHATAATLVPAALSKKDPIRVFTEQVDSSWGETNIMNDYGVVLTVLELEGEHGESAVPIDKDDAIDAARELFVENIFEKYGDDLAKGLKARDLKIKASATAFKVEAARKALNYMAVEGFGFDPKGLEETLRAPLGDEDDKSYTMLGTFQAILKKLEINSKTGAIIRLDTQAKRAEDGSEKFTQFVFLNHKTGLFLNVFVRHARM